MCNYTSLNICVSDEACKHLLGVIVKLVIKSVTRNGIISWWANNRNLVTFAQKLSIIIKYYNYKIRARAYFIIVYFFIRFFFLFSFFEKDSCNFLTIIVNLYSYKLCMLLIGKKLFNYLRIPRGIVMLNNSCRDSFSRFLSDMQSY